MKGVCVGGYVFVKPIYSYSIHIGINSLKIYILNKFSNSLTFEKFHEITLVKKKSYNLSCFTPNSAIYDGHRKKLFF